MTDLIAAILTAFFALFWIAVQIAGWLILGIIVLGPIAWVVSLFVAPPR